MFTPSPLTPLAASLSPLSLASSPHYGLGEDEEATLAAAAAAANLNNSPFVKRAQGNGFKLDITPFNFMSADPAILVKSTGFANLEAARLKANEALKSDWYKSLTEKDQSAFQRFLAGLLHSYVHEECEGRAATLRKGVQKTLTGLTRYDPSQDEPIVIRDSPDKISLAAEKLDKEYISSQSYSEAFAKTLEKALKRITNSRDAGDSHTGSPPTPSLSTTVEEDLSSLLRDSIHKRKVKTTSDFGLHCAIAIDKLLACVNVATSKGDFETAHKLGMKGKEVENKVKEFLGLADVLGFSKARELYLAVKNPFSTMRKEHWDLLTGAAQESNFKAAVEEVFGGLAPISKPLKRQRAADSGEDSEGSSPRPKKHKKGARKPCSYCGKPGHHYDNCYKRKREQSKGKK